MAPISRSFEESTEHSLDIGHNPKVDVLNDVNKMDHANDQRVVNKASLESSYSKSYETSSMESEDDSYLDSDSEYYTGESENSAGTVSQILAKFANEKKSNANSNKFVEPEFQDVLSTEESMENESKELENTFESTSQVTSNSANYKNNKRDLKQKGKTNKKMENYIKMPIGELLSKLILRNKAPMSKFKNSDENQISESYESETNSGDSESSAGTVSEILADKNQISKSYDSETSSGESENSAGTVSEILEKFANKNSHGNNTNESLRHESKEIPSTNESLENDSKGLNNTSEPASQIFRTIVQMLTNATNSTNNAPVKALKDNKKKNADNYFKLRIGELLSKMKSRNKASLAKKKTPGEDNNGKTNYDSDYDPGNFLIQNFEL